MGTLPVACANDIWFDIASTACRSQLGLIYFFAEALCFIARRVKIVEFYHGCIEWGFNWSPLICASNIFIRGLTKRCGNKRKAVYPCG